MAKFRFPFRALQKVRKNVEENAQVKHQVAKAKLKDHLNLIEQMYRQIDEAREQIQQKQLDSAPVTTVQSLEEFIVGQNLKIEQARRQARDLMAEEELAAKQFFEAYKSRKILDALFEKRMSAHKKQIKKSEEKAFDELAIMKYRGNK